MTELRRKPEVDYYKVLQVDSDAEPEVIEAAYRALSKKYHPDINSAADAMTRMSQINSAYMVLNDPSKRRNYNSLRNTDSKSAASPVSSNPTTNSGYWSPANQPTTGGATSAQNVPKPGPSVAPKPPPPPGNNNGSFRPQNSYPSSNPTPPGAPKRPVPRPAPPEEDLPPRSRAGFWILLTLVVLILLGVGGVLAQEAYFNNPLKTSFLGQASNTSTTPTLGPRPVAPTAAATALPVAPASREQVSNYLNNPDLYAGRVTDVGLTSPDVLQLKVKLAANGAVLNSETPVQGRPADELDQLRQAEATTYNLVYSLFGRFSDLSRINLVVSDRDKPVYRADVARSQAYSFYPWQANQNSADPGEASKTARQNRLAFHFGVTLDDAVRTRLSAPTESNLQNELYTIGLTAFSVTGGPQPVVNYFQVRSQAEMAVDFARIIYTLYTRFPTLDRLQISLSASADKPTKAIDRQLFTQTPLETWAQASYGGAVANGDRLAQKLISDLPATPADLKLIPATITAKFKTAVQVGNWYVVTESVERYDSLSLEGIRFPAAKDRQFVVVRVALRNTADSRQWLLPGERMAFLDTRGPVYQADPAATMLYLLRTPPAAEVPPGPIEASKQGAVYVVFSVPTNTNLATLRLQFQDGDKKAALELG